MYPSARPLTEKQPDDMAVPPGENVNTSLQAFRNEVAQYCEGITDSASRRYAEQYAAALQQRASSVEFKEPRNPGLFQADRNLIRAALQASYRKHLGRPGNLRKQACVSTDEHG